MSGLIFRKYLNGGADIETEAKDMVCVFHDSEEAYAYGPLFAASPKLLEALKEINGLIEKGVLVRSIEQDSEPDWAVRSLPLIRAISSMQTAIDQAEGR